MQNALGSANGTNAIKVEGRGAEILRRRRLANLFFSDARADQPRSFHVITTHEEAIIYG